MRDDLNASEKRLIAALDRIDHFIDRATLARVDVPAPVAGTQAGVEEQLHAAQSENRRLSGELVLLHERQAALLAQCETQLTQSHERLLGAGQEAARLVAANEALTEANRALIAAAGVPADDARLALEAEIESLRAARDAEVAQMGDLLTVLDRMIGTPAPEAVEAPRGSSRSAAVSTPRAKPASAPAVAPVQEMPMPEQVADFAEASHDRASADAEDAAGPAEERG